jgi:nucleoside-diphosphate-sugar epimerase
MIQTILVTGSRGVIGKVLCPKLRNLGYEVIGTRREFQETEDDTEISIKPWSSDFSCNKKIDLIIHLAGEYLTKYESSTIEKCFEANLGLAATIAHFQSHNPVPMIALGSFFEKAPEEFQPWSFYANSKIASFGLLKESTYLSKSKLVYLYLYDTYGSNTSRGKFIDILLDSLGTSEEIDASQGRQIQDLTHIEDVVSGITQIVADMGEIEIGTHEFQIRSREVFSLRELVDLYNSLSSKLISVNWGKYPYRNREVFELWDSAPDLPNWKPMHNVMTLFEEKLGSTSPRIEN